MVRSTFITMVGKFPLKCFKTDFYVYINSYSTKKLMNVDYFQHRGFKFDQKSVSCNS